MSALYANFRQGKVQLEMIQYSRDRPVGPLSPSVIHSSPSHGMDFLHIMLPTPVSPGVDPNQWCHLMPILERRDRLVTHCIAGLGEGEPTLERQDETRLENRNKVYSFKISFSGIQPANFPLTWLETWDAYWKCSSQENLLRSTLLTWQDGGAGCEVMLWSEK